MRNTPPAIAAIPVRTGVGDATSVAAMDMTFTSQRDDRFGRERRPGFIGIELLDCLSELRCLLAKIALPDDAVLVDDERHHAAHAVHVGAREQRVPARQSVVLYIVARAARRRRTLREKHAVTIAVVR